MTIPRQLAPTMGPAHGGFEFLKGNFEGLKGYVVGRMTKGHRGKIYIDDKGWGPDAGSIEYGYRVPLAESTSSSAGSESRDLSWTVAPTSSRRLSVRGRPGLSRS